MKKILLILALLSVHTSALTIGQAYFTRPQLPEVLRVLFNASKSVQERLKIDALEQEIDTYARALQPDFDALGRIEDPKERNDAAKKWDRENLKKEIPLKTKVPITINLSESGYLSMTAEQLAIARVSGLFIIITPKADTTATAKDTTGRK